MTASCSVKSSEDGLPHLEFSANHPTAIVVENRFGFGFSVVVVKSDVRFVAFGSIVIDGPPGTFGLIVGSLESADHVMKVM